MIKIYYNPACSKCRIAKEFLKDEDLEIIEYLKDTPSESELKNILKKLGMKPIEIVRRKENIFQEKFANKEFSDEDWIHILVKNPKLIQRPIITKGDKATVGRSEEALRKIKNS
jgi:arsenate reductase (glutaredoxin)